MKRVQKGPTAKVMWSAKSLASSMLMQCYTKTVSNIGTCALARGREGVDGCVRGATPSIAQGQERASGLSAKRDRQVMMEVDVLGVKQQKKLRG